MAFLFDGKEINDYKIDGIDYRDYPDFCNGFIESASFKDRQLTQQELNRLNDDLEFADMKYEMIWEQLH